MISLDLARKLKEAGLKPAHDECEQYWIAEVEEVMHVSREYAPEPDDIWIPRLDQLLKEIKKRYQGIIHIWNPEDDRGIWAVSIGGRFWLFFDENVENAVARALLALLEKKQG